MNFLAHLYLSGDKPETMVGNFMGDFVKGRNLGARFGGEIALGIELHRSIDAFTDSHPVVAASKSRLRAKYRHYAPVIVDVFYDHLLAKNWHMHHAKSLNAFANDAYKTITDFKTILPEEAKHMLPYMISGNWLVNYGRIEGIEKALSGMSRRTKFDSKMDESAADLLAHYDDFNREFKLFFPELINFCNQFIYNNRIKDLL